MNENKARKEKGCVLVSAHITGYIEQDHCSDTEPSLKLWSHLILTGEMPSVLYNLSATLNILYLMKIQVIKWQWKIIA